VPLLESGHAGFILWMTASQGLVWALGAAAAIWGMARAASGADVARLAAACAVGLLAFLVQDTINFAMFVPSARANFFGLLAVVLAIKLYPMEESGTQPVPAHRKRERAVGASRDRAKDNGHSAIARSLDRRGPGGGRPGIHVAAIPARGRGATRAR
jgi:hypothetical protein